MCVGSFFLGIRSQISGQLQVLTAELYSRLNFIYASSQNQRSEIESHQDEYQSLAAHLEDLRTMCDPNERKTLNSRYRVFFLDANAVNVPLALVIQLVQAAGELIMGLG